MSAKMGYSLKNPSTLVGRFYLVFRFSLKGTVSYWVYASVSGYADWFNLALEYTVPQ